MRRGAFTLLELILALSLSTMLLAGLWTALQVHTRMFQGGQSDVAAAQLGRALLRRIGDDLRSTIAPAVAPTGTGSTSTAPAVGSGTGESGTGGSTTGGSANVASSSTAAPAPAGATPTRLRGTTRWLQIEVDQTLTVPPAPVETTVAMQDFVATPVGLNQVTYFVRQPFATVAGDEPQAAGLVRRELSCLYRDQLAAQERRPAGAGMANAGGGQAAPAARSDEEPPELPPLFGAEVSPTGEAIASPEVLLSPEVVALEFRYFDGAAWQESWDSAAAGGLPQSVAVAVALATEGLDDPDQLRAPRNKVEELGAEPALDPRQVPLFESSETELPWKIYRLTVLLPAGLGPSATSESATSDLPAAKPAASSEPSPPPSPGPGGGA